MPSPSRFASLRTAPAAAPTLCAACGRDLRPRDLHMRVVPFVLGLHVGCAPALARRLLDAWRSAVRVAESEA